MDSARLPWSLADSGLPPYADVGVRGEFGELIYVPAVGDDDPPVDHDRGMLIEHVVAHAKRMARTLVGVARLMRRPWYVRAVAAACFDGSSRIRQRRERVGGLPAFYDLACLVCMLRAAEHFAPDISSVCKWTIRAEGALVEGHRHMTGEAAECAANLDWVGPSVMAALRARPRVPSLVNMAAATLWNPAHVYTPMDDHVPHVMCAAINDVPVRLALAIEEHFRATRSVQ
jgi:hypothetical protein